MTFYTLFERSGTTGNDQNGSTIRQHIPVAAYKLGAPPTGIGLRVTWRAASAGNLNIANASIGHASSTTGDLADFDGTQVPVLNVGSAPNFSITAGSELVSQKSTYAFDLTKPLVVAGEITFPGNILRLPDPLITSRYTGSPASQTDVTTTFNPAEVAFPKVEVEFNDPPGAPTCNIGPAPGQSSPTSESATRFRIDWNKGVTGLTLADIDISTSTAGGTLVASALIGTDFAYEVTVTGMLTVGNVTVRIPAGAVNAIADGVANAAAFTGSILWDPTLTDPHKPNVFEVTMVDRDMIRVEVRDPAVEIGHTENLSTPDTGTGYETVTGAANNGHGMIRITTPYASSVNTIYIQNMTASPVSNGAGGQKIRCTVYDTSSLGGFVKIAHALGTLEANFSLEPNLFDWSITVINSTTFDLNYRTDGGVANTSYPSAFVNTYFGGGVVQAGLGRFAGMDQQITIHNVGGVPEAQGSFLVSRSSATTIDLLDSVWVTRTYTSGGLIMPTGFGQRRWVDRIHPITGLNERCKIMGTDAKMRRWGDRGPHAPSGYLNRQVARVAANYGLIGPRTVTNVYYKAMAYSGGYGDLGPLTINYPSVSFRHYLYLKLDGNLTNGTYTIIFPVALGIPPYTFTYNDKTTRCCAIRVNQVGHRPADPSKLGYLVEWIPGLGAWGEKSFSAVTNYHLIDGAGTIVWSAGTAPIQRATPTSIEGTASGSPQGPRKVAAPVEMKITGITKANPARVTVVDASQVSNGDTVQFSAMTHYDAGGGQVGMGEVAITGFDINYWVIGNKSGNSFDLIGCNSTGFSDFAHSMRDDVGNFCYKTNIAANRSQTFVYGLPYSAPSLPAGTYRLYIANIGVSHPIHFKESSWYEVARVNAMGMYHERVGGVCDGRFGFTRPLTMRNRPSQHVYKSYVPYLLCGYGGYGIGNLDVGDAAKGTGAGYTPWKTFAEDNSFGGHMDAGDWDSRFFECAPGYYQILDTYEHLPSISRNVNHGLPTCIEAGLDPTVFAGTDALPSPLVEVIWGIEQQRAGQWPNGMVSGGMNYGEGIDDNETSPTTGYSLYTYYPEHVSAYLYAAVAGKLARILKSIGYTTLGSTYQTSAVAAYTWAESIHTNTATRDAHYQPVKDLAMWSTATYNSVMTNLTNIFVHTARAHGAASLFYLTNNSSYKTTCDFYFPMSTAAPREGLAAWEYAQNPASTSASRAEIRLQLASWGLNSFVYSYEAPDLNYAFPAQKSIYDMAFGGPTQMIGSVPALLVAAIIFSDTSDSVNYDPAKAARCRAALQHHYAFRQGANQSDVCLTQGLGVRNLKETLHVDSRMTEQPIPKGLASEGWCNEFAILGVAIGNGTTSRVQHPVADPYIIDFDPTAFYREMYPNDMMAWPRFEFLIENQSAVEHMEFTTQQQMIPAYAGAYYLHAFDGNTDVGDVEAPSAAYIVQRPLVRLR